VSLWFNTTQGLVCVRCIYPQRKPNPGLGRDPCPSFKTNSKWKVKESYSKDKFTRFLRREARYPGNIHLLACGDNSFVKEMKEVAISNSTPDHIITFANPEFCPPKRADGREKSRMAHAVEAVTQVLDIV
jgi:hypothetical protein